MHYIIMDMSRMHYIIMDMPRMHYIIMVLQHHTTRALTGSSNICQHNSLNNSFPLCVFAFPTCY